MDLVSLLLNAEAGAIAGFLVGEFLLRRRPGLLGSVGLGVLGGVTGDWLLQQLDVLPPAGASFTGLMTHALAIGAIGAVVTLLVGGLWKWWYLRRHRSLPPPHRSSQR